MPTYYYPEGPIGPVCDLPGSIQGDFGNLPQDVIEEILDLGDNRVVTYGPIVFPDLDFFMGGPVTTILTRRCKVRELEDGTIEYYDCKDVFNNPDGGSQWPLGPGGYDWETASNNPWGLDDDFDDLTLTPEACLPHDPDINILPQRFYLADGSFVLKRLIEKSTPVTFPVNSGGENSASTIDGAIFTRNGDAITLESTGSGNANIGIVYKWDDNPSTAGTALSGINLSGVTFNQSGQKGQTSGTIGITAGNNYPVSLNPGNGFGGFEIQNGGKKVCFFDLDDDDCNSELYIEGAVAEDTVPNEPGYWSDDANKYAVWVNPELCTLPFLPQQVTYLVDIPATDTYTITGGADDNFNVFFNDETTPVIGGAGGIFAGGALNTPYSATRSLTAGTLKIVVDCTNSAAGFTDAAGDPTGLAFSWDRNPGGWYLKLCRGNACTSGAALNWRKSGPHPAWSSFMSKYAVFPSNNETLSGIPQTGAWTVNIPSPGDYTLEVQADNSADISFDGTALGTVNSFTNSTNYTLSNVSVGPHTISAVVTNTSPPSGTADQWATNPAGVAWKLTSVTGSSITASFNSNGDLVVDGIGTADIELDFEWDDNPSTAGTALGTVRWEVSAGSAPIEFTQTSGASSGSDSATRNLAGDATYRIQIFDSTGGFDVKNNGQKLCFKDFDGNDCNAEVTIGSTANNGPSKIADSTQTSAPSKIPGNMIWNTRDDVLYEYVPVGNCIVQGADSTYGTGFFGYLLYNDGTVQQGDFITQLKPEYKLEPVFSGSGFQTNYTALGATIFNSYLNTIGRFPEPAGFDGWINDFTSNPMYTSLTVLTTAIYNSYITAPPNGSGEQALQTSRGGLTGNYDNCDTRRV
jgi:hypothetical protein